MTGRVTAVAALADRVKEMAGRRGAAVCGVAAAEAFDMLAPEGHRPRDLLPGARSVVVAGGAAPRAGDWRSPLSEHLESMGTTQRIEPVGRALAVFIEDELGHYALAVPGGLGRGGQPFLSLALAAELAGLGTRSLAGPVLHPERGLLYFAAVITTLPLPPDGPLAEPACPAPPCLEQWRQEGTTPCLAVCPVAAGGCLGGRLDGGRFARTGFARERCTTRVHTHWIGGFQKVLEAALDEPDRDKRKMLLYGTLFTKTLWSIAYAGQSQAQCFECMRVCPVGQAHRTRR